MMVMVTQDEITDHTVENLAESFGYTLQGAAASTTYDVPEREVVLR